MSKESKQSAGIGGSSRVRESDCRECRRFQAQEEERVRSCAARRTPVQVPENRREMPSAQLR
jgi:hypothetical protein